MKILDAFIGALVAVTLVGIACAAQNAHQEAKALLDEA